MKSTRNHKKRAKIKRCAAAALAAALCLMTLGACGSKSETTTTSAATGRQEQTQEIKSLSRNGRTLGTWTVYWDGGGAVRTLAKNAGRIDSVGVFAADYPDGKTLTLPEKSASTVGQIKASETLKQMPVYLSVVNDTKDEEKSVTLLNHLIGTSSQAEASANAIVDMAKSYNCDGVEIDFEKIRKDTALWARFVDFENRLIAECNANGLKLRIVLETLTPMESINLPSGPEYVVMCYNLYGNGTKPGPKADRAFLKETAGRFEKLGNVTYALANGGFNFKGSQQAEAVTADEAAALMKKHDAKPKRDKDSGALYFKYGSHTVWYADAKTLSTWAETLDQAANRKVTVALWRL
ncbi:glycosyl hydrolase family 18 protein [uncultured Pseudoramibacter sp.]|uniref:glycosyl hydrolase family 18 protein n=1 Tax=uncultured Pseudoramibacter sp. TaxID=1623493 RepID=UPI0025DAA305|nr:glycosyl hydrolase family 18 protein [uncultured Pseudoramibacter sp.]